MLKRLIPKPFDIFDDVLIYLVTVYHCLHLFSIIYISFVSCFVAAENFVFPIELLISSSTDIHLLIFIC